ncbi:hypothetical protein DL98DRAFT_584610 [Cadophora sp. DSE1049]|nr:hypothetical protein DL98DRAFT_584610 [Cadophora sp. DSE1049]
MPKVCESGDQVSLEPFGIMITSDMRAWSSESNELDCLQLFGRGILMEALELHSTIVPDVSLVVNALFWIPARFWHMNSKIQCILGKVEISLQGEVFPTGYGELRLEVFISLQSQFSRINASMKKSSRYFRSSKPVSPWDKMRTRFGITPIVDFHGNFSGLNILDGLCKDSGAQLSWEFWEQREIIEWFVFRMMSLGKRSAL